MNKFITAMAGLAAMSIASPAMAEALVVEGISYELTQTSITDGGLTGNFILEISGINTASDTEGGRTGINAFAFNDAPTAVSGLSDGFTFQLGGLNSTGCSGSGNGFFCFDNTSATFPAPLTDSLSLMFSVTSDTSGVWLDWDPSFKIDWVGSKNNYDLVSLPISVNTPVPEPGTWAMMLMGFGAAGYAMRRSKRQGKLISQQA